VAGVGGKDSLFDEVGVELPPEESVYFSRNMSSWFSIMIPRSSVNKRQRAISLDSNSEGLKIMSANVCAKILILTLLLVDR
jgi:hypothetical protein